MSGFEKTDEAVANILAIVKTGREVLVRRVHAIFHEHGIVSTGYMSQALGWDIGDTEGMLRHLEGVQSIGVTRDGTLWRLL